MWEIVFFLLFFFKHQWTFVSRQISTTTCSGLIMRTCRPVVSPCLFIYFGCPVMWRTLGRGQIMSTAGMCPLSTLHGDGSYSTWPQDGSKDPRGLLCENPLLFWQQNQTAKHANSVLLITLLYLQFRFYNVLFWWGDKDKGPRTTPITHYFIYFSVKLTQLCLYSTIFTL